MRVCLLVEHIPLDNAPGSLIRGSRRTYWAIPVCTFSAESTHTHTPHTPHTHIHTHTHTTHTTHTHTHTHTYTHTHKHTHTHTYTYTHTYTHTHKHKHSQPNWDGNGLSPHFRSKPPPRTLPHHPRSGHSHTKGGTYDRSSN